MKTNKFPIAIAAMMFVSAAFISSCKKHENEDKDTTEASDHTLVEHTTNDIVNIEIGRAHV